MPFNPFRRGRQEEPKGASSPAPAPGGRRVRFDGLSEEWRLVGYMQIAGRLSDALNRREPIELVEMQWASVVDGGALEDAPGLRTIDPYDLIIVLAGEESLPPLSEEEKSAFRVHKVPYDVELELPPYHVVGRVYLFPGTDPAKLLDRATDMFLPVTDAVATVGGRRVNDPRIDTILVNRFYLRGVDQVETASTAEGATRTAGSPSGNVTDPDPASDRGEEAAPGDAAPAADDEPSEAEVAAPAGEASA